jgi:predicted CXXCH cytochrome family protein
MASRLQLGLAVALAISVLGACGHPGEARRAPASAPAPIFVPIPEADAARVRNVHDHAGKPLCQRCHTPAGGLVAAPNALCRSCHDVGHSSHPVEVVRRGAAQGLPLLEGGKLACHTCHDPHDVRRNRGLRKGFDSLCASCHEK